MIEYEYSFKVTNIKPFISFCKIMVILKKKMFCKLEFYIEMVTKF